MELTINGETQQFFSGEDRGEAPLPELLTEIGFGEVPVLVEHNGIALRARDHAKITVKAGDQLEIIRIVAGG